MAIAQYDLKVLLEHYVKPLLKPSVYSPQADADFDGMKRNGFWV
ncbi:hypothetical protein C1H76_6232 [Elsinoe australis]|uniref:Uncharacterized protein n=1 Tax=Elsinoe australis TaxID=40998 RepID=A0A4U7AZ09_9PEZI|nr:hypothetical protein C1H76_6232 [Elsinoe australis]